METPDSLRLQLFELIKELPANNVDQLYKDIPKSIFRPDIGIADGLTEPKVQLEIERVANNNTIYPKQKSFLGAGVYYRHIPAIVDHLVNRSEFFTAYTPYQPEISQGTLTAIFEFQTYMAELTGMEISNASLYDGATALSESIQMVSRVSNKKTVNVSVIGMMSENYRSVLETYNKGFNNELSYFDDLAEFRMEEGVDALVFMYPNFFGQVIDYTSLIEEAKKLGTAIIFCVPNPLALMIFKTPGELGADIVCGEAISLGSYPAFGGPGLGFLTTRQDLVRNMPGRIVGETEDAKGNKGFVLTFQTREQHIRRERATSNICSNQGLLALRTAIYFSYMGQSGLVDLAEDIYEKTQYLKKKLSDIDGLEVDRNVSFQDALVYFGEISINALNGFLKENGVLGGFDLSKMDEDLDGYCLITVNDYMEKNDIDELVAYIEEFICG